MSAARRMSHRVNLYSRGCYDRQKENRLQACLLGVRQPAQIDEVPRAGRGIPLVRKARARMDEKGGDKMSKTNIKRTNFTPLLDSLVDEYGITTAAVFGRVWRYCQMDNGYCHAEQERIADELNIRRETVNRCLKELVRDGYLTDTTPNAKGRTRIYKDTGKAGIKRLPTAEADPEPVSEPVIKSHTKTLKTDKKEKDTTTSSVGVSFLEKASQEQKTAYDLVRRFASEEKAVEVASREHPLEAARDFLEWCAERGGKAAERILDELQAEERRAEVIDKLKQMFVEAAQSVGYTDAVTHSMFDEWLDGAIGGREINYTLLRYVDSIKTSMRSFFNLYDSGESVSFKIDKSEGMYV